MAINETGVAFATPATVLTVGVADLNISVGNLGLLSGVEAGPSLVPLGSWATSLTREEDGNVLNVGEEFVLSRTFSPALGEPNTTTETLTMEGTGTVTGIFGTRTFIIASTEGGVQRIIFPDGDLPPVTDVLLTLDTDTFLAGYDFDADDIVCFARGTLVDTPEGPRAIEDLQAGDMILTKDNGPQPLRWIGRTVVSASTLARKDNLRPIRIRAGALGAGAPSSDLIVSPQHRMLVRSNIAQKMFGTMEVLVAAKQLLQIEGVDIARDLESVEYFHMLFDRHEVVFANGAESESLYTGPQALKGVGLAALDEIFALFPQLQEADYEAEGARYLVSGRHGRKLAIRHKQNHRALVR
ncbi:Hint domain-containing protein [Paracoccus nototheniae]|uniref:Hint domain-containing protein n=1 Tax=Paracoccus nototheniae TaxID=2489002 RepID=A0ABW4DXU6_9RHOB|nr:Hint domain-containing protein [Paracoccus nototheniae]